MRSWIEYDEECEFPLENIPFGAFLNPNVNEVHCCTRIGNQVIDLSILEHERLLSEGPVMENVDHHVFCEATLNKFMELGKAAKLEVRSALQSIFAEGSEKLTDELKQASMFPAESVELRMPVFVRDYTDFYSSYSHAYNVGCIIRGPDNAIQPNWLHLPVGYHGRASSIVLSGTPVRRPKGQVSADKKVPTWSACQRMDLELEMGTFIGRANNLGDPIPVNEARDYIFGFCLLNDWSARDMQTWEYVPLGPFNAKNFASTISPWVVTPEALAPFKVALDAQDPGLLPYLQDNDLSSYNVNLEICLKTPAMSDYHKVATSNMRYLYYSVPQTIAHHSVTGCNMSVGDMLGTGTISGPDKTQYGSLLELCWAGKEDIALPGGETRKFLRDGDSVLLRGVCKGAGYTIGFGECEGTVVPAHDDARYLSSN